MGNFNRLLATAAATAAIVAPAQAGTGETTPGGQKEFLETAAGDPFTYIKAPFLDIPGPNKTVEVNDRRYPNDIMANPAVISYGGRIVRYATISDEGGRPHIKTVAVGRAEVHKRIGQREIPVQHVGRLVTEHIVHAYDDDGASPTAFVDKYSSYAFEP
ncbi:MAG TPA: hypothetical protein VM535_00975 [Candidatus Saccharimonadales bacterium]|nr:hypothetical protein [Candidatus Saccharimonadales bacterium]